MRTRSPASIEWGRRIDARDGVTARRAANDFDFRILSPGGQLIGGRYLVHCFRQSNAGRERLSQHRNFVADRCQLTIEFLASILSELRLLLFRLGPR